MQTDVYIKIINEKMNMEFWMAGFLVIPKVYAVIASPFNEISSYRDSVLARPYCTSFVLPIRPKDGILNRGIRVP